ncbi:tRNA dihydrouridine synthase DusB [Teredinibacter sp. KSP-S5-2]|uniref:tRNA dihydrouridine synthase DusB n=1 Tax=Teredinibacter sp. KSP-S5-2 TaxID=3034506 RepID=UPI0029350B60|nr:tRNA dihydrouridine synthase DusB [Teredinibacter sp. KSP-S5-2]
MFSIGPYKIASRVLLAPMAGVTDAPFRKICQNFGAGLTTSEMVTSNTQLWQSDKSRTRLSRIPGSDKTPFSVQIAGSDPSMMADAAQQSVEQGADIIDINMGCPAKKVCKKLAGSALLANESLVEDILSTVVKSVNVPVTLKTRTGTSQEHKNATRIAAIAENAGIQAIALHGRTRSCRFKGEAEYDTIAAVVREVSIPVIANGDIDSPAKARDVLDYTKASAIMVGRKSLGNPWIFQQINAFLNSGELPAMPTVAEKKKIILQHLRGLHAFYGEYQGVRIARKHFGWYCENIPNTKPLVKEFNTLETSKSQTNAVYEFFERFHIYEEKAA